MIIVLVLAYIVIGVCLTPFIKIDVEAGECMNPGSLKSKVLTFAIKSLMALAAPAIVLMFLIFPKLQDKLSRGVNIYKNK